jgi:hypothetical protein
MASFNPDRKAIDRRRRSTEARLSRLLQKAGTDFPVDAIQSLVFGYHHTRFNTYLVQLRTLFASLDNPVNENVALPLIEDAWNYFPHESLNGRSPAEVMSDYSRSGERQPA